ncbi:MAG: shikimate kinase [Clostridiales bacterium]|nr:shikimate kinase [Clostridiales bacterium]
MYRNNQKSNITLIGMPACGKSTVGVLLAKRLGYSFIDVDIVIQEQTGKLLREIIADAGTAGFLETENQINAQLTAQRAVIAPGGSVVYGEAAMTHLREISTVVYLKLSFEEVEKRLGDLTDRGVAFGEGMTLREIYEERIPLYEKYADITIEEDKKSPGQVVDELRHLFEKQG